jgi:hypothetical protein
MNEIPQITGVLTTTTEEKFVITRISESLGGMLISSHYISEPQKNGWPVVFGGLINAFQFSSYNEAMEKIKTLAPGFYQIDKIFLVKA